ncbi:sugar-binding domain-containing protein [Lachnospiraceae bacterium 62-26]
MKRMSVAQRWSEKFNSNVTYLSAPGIVGTPEQWRLFMNEFRITKAYEAIQEAEMTISGIGTPKGVLVYWRIFRRIIQRSGSNGWSKIVSVILCSISIMPEVNLMPGYLEVRDWGDDRRLYEDTKPGCDSIRKRKDSGDPCGHEGRDCKYYDNR